MDYEYDPALDRLDVAVRAVWHDALTRNGRLLEEAGVEREVVTAVQALAQSYSRPATESQVFALLRECPAVLPAALLMLAAYYQRCGEGRAHYYARLEALYEPVSPQV